jgi:hypothetical protein
MVHNLISKCDSERIALEAGNCPNDRPMRAKDVGSCLPECPVLTLRGGTGFYALTVFRTPRAHAALICYFRFVLRFQRVAATQASNVSAGV